MRTFFIFSLFIFAACSRVSDDRPTTAPQKQRAIKVSPLKAFVDAGEALLEKDDRAAREKFHRAGELFDNLNDEPGRATETDRLLAAQAQFRIYELELEDVLDEVQVTHSVSESEFVALKGSITNGSKWVSSYGRTEWADRAKKREIEALKTIESLVVDPSR